jgi:hypothetical protein
MPVPRLLPARPRLPPHHIIPRSQGGPTSLANLINLCTYHLIAIHRWGWTITLHPDGTVTATSPHGRTLHSHSPPPPPPEAGGLRLWLM